MSEDRIPEHLELDGAIELVRCADLRAGWSVADVRATYSPERFGLPAGLATLREAWRERNPLERSDPKLAWREFSRDERGRLVCSLQPTAWDEVRPLHESPPSDLAKVLKSLPQGYEMLVPNIGVVHVIVATSDGWILAIRRSDSLHYHPGAWSATYEEGLDPSDLDADGVFHRAARRGLAEELVPGAEQMSLDAFRVVSVIFERPIVNPAAVVIANLPMTQREILKRPPSDELDASSVLAIPLDEKVLGDVVASSVPDLGSRSGKWHPTARYRLLVALAHFFGEETAAAAEQRVSRR